MEKAVLFYDIKELFYQKQFIIKEISTQRIGIISKQQKQETLQLILGNHFGWSMLNLICHGIL